MEEPSRERIEETVTDILKQADMEAMTEFKVRALASEKLNFDLSSSPHLRLLIRNIVESFLLSLPPAHDVVSPPAPATTKIADNGDLIICELSKCRRVVVQDFRGKPLVSIREFYNKGGKLLPSARGISLSTEQWSAFKKNIPGIEEAIKVMQSRIGPKVDGKEAEDASNAMSACIPPSKEDGKQFENASNVMSVCIPPKEEGSVNPGIPCNKDGKQIEAESNAMGARVPPIDVESKNPIISLNEDGKQIEDASTSMTTCISPKDGKPIEDVSSSVSAGAPQGLVHIQTTRFDGKNYESWVQKMNLFLKQLKIAYVLFDPCPIVPSVGNDDEVARVKAAFRRWVDDDYICHRTLLSSLSDDLFSIYSRKTRSAKELWEDLKLTYFLEKFGTRRSQVRKYIEYQMVEGKSVINQVQEFNLIADSVVANRMFFDENFHVSVIISKLPPSWSDYRVKLMQKEVLPLGMLMECLRVEEECRNADKNLEPLVNHNLNPAKKQKPDMNRPGILGKSQEPGKDKKGLVCFSCGKQGHFSRNCWSRKSGSEVGKRIDKENPSTPVTDVNMVEKVAE